MDTYVRSDLDQNKIWKIIFSHGCSPVSGQASSAGHCWHLQEVLFPRPLLYPLFWNLVAQCLPQCERQDRGRLLSCPQVPAAVAGAGLKHCFTAPASQWALVAPAGSFGQGCHPAQLAGTKHCSALAPSPVTGRILPRGP